MSDNSANLQRKMANAVDLHSVVRTMKSLAASNIGQFEKAVQSLEEYSHSVELGLGAYLRAHPLDSKPAQGSAKSSIIAVVFGSDQGLVGQFNDVIADYAKAELNLGGRESKVWSVGERVQSRLVEAGLDCAVTFEVPNSVNTITLLISQILIRYEDESPESEIHLFFNQGASGVSYSPVHLKLLPLDHVWEEKMLAVRWPSKLLPEFMGVKTLPALIQEYLFISMFRACAESLKAENASRLASMQRADKNISELVEKLTNTFNHLRQSQIDEELFDVVSGFENLAKHKKINTATPPLASHNRLEMQ